MEEITNGMPATLIDEAGNVYSSMTALAKMLRVDRKRMSRCIKQSGTFKHAGHSYSLAPANVVASTLRGPNGTIACIQGGHQGVCRDQDAGSASKRSRNSKTVQQTVVQQVYVEKPREDEAEYQEFRKVKESEKLPFDHYKFAFRHNYQKGYRYAVALFSDAHIEETVNPKAVDNRNEYNIDIARQRIEKYFVNLVNCLNEDKVDELIFASLGDTISGFIHEELSQENGLTPIEAVYEAQNLIFGGLDYICRNTNLKNIRFIGIVGNHSRTTRKIQHANGFKMSYEWLMYKNIEKECRNKKLPIEFCLPESEIAFVEIDGRKFLFAHGYQLKGSGTGAICGIYPALGRLFSKWERVFKQDHMFIGHFHSCTFIPNATVNGSIIGYNAYALSNGMGYEDPAQCYIVYDTEIGGELLTRKIYCK